MNDNELARLEVWLEVNKALSTRWDADVRTVITEASVAIQRAARQHEVCAEIEQQIEDLKQK